MALGLLVLATGGLLIAEEAKPANADPAGGPAPTQLHVPPPRFGDQATYDDEGTNWTAVVSIDEARRTRDGFSRVHDAVILQENLTGPNTTQWEDTIVALDATSGTQLWSQRPITVWNNWTWERSYSTYGLPSGFGTSILTDRTLEPGQRLSIPLYDGWRTHRATYAVQPPVERSGEWWWPVRIEVHGVPGGTELGGFGLAEGTVWLSNDTWLPERVSWMGRRGPIPGWGYTWTQTWQRMDHERGHGSQAWLVDDPIVPEKPWPRRPRWTYWGPGNGTQPFPTQGSAYANFTYGEMLWHAQNYSTGLDEFRNRHDRVLFISSGPAGESGKGYLIGRQDTETWELEWAPVNRSERYIVEVTQERRSIAGRIVHEHTYISNEYNVSEPPSGGTAEDARPVSHGLGLVDEWAAWIPQSYGNYELWDRNGLGRTYDLETWTYQTQAGYWASYWLPESCDGAICFIRGRSVGVDATTGSLVDVEGELSFLRKFDEEGLTFDGPPPEDPAWLTVDTPPQTARKVSTDRPSAQGFGPCDGASFRLEPAPVAGAMLLESRPAPPSVSVQARAEPQAPHPGGPPWSGRCPTVR